jgi:hypothetical protein
MLEVIFDVAFSQDESYARCFGGHQLFLCFVAEADTACC